MIQNLSEQFSELRFDEPSHTYMVGGQAKKPVSNCIHDFVEYVDFDEKAKGVAEREGVTQQEILGRWKTKNKIATDKGTRVHLFAEGDMLTPVLPEEYAVVKFWMELDTSRYRLVCKELRMYHFNHPLAGTSDLLLYDTLTETYIIADYKTNENLFKNFKGQTLLEPFEYLLDHPYNHYQLQLSFYQLLVEQVKGVTVSERWVIWLKADGGYQLFKTEDFTADLKTHLLCS